MLDAPGQGVGVPTETTSRPWGQVVAVATRAIAAKAASREAVVGHMIAVYDRG